MTYRDAYLLAAKRARILVACNYDQRQAQAVEEMLRARGCWPNDNGGRS